MFDYADKDTEDLSRRQDVVYRMLTSFLTIPLLKRAKEEGTEMEEGILEEFSEATDVAEKLFIKYLKASGMGVKYIYLSKKTAESVSFTVTPEMIKRNLGD